MLGASHLGTFPCAHWPGDVKLYDYNQVFKASHQRLRNVIGLDDLPRANATVIGQYYTDDQHSRDLAVQLARAGQEVAMQYHMKINTVLLNAYLPLGCIKAKACSGSGSGSGSNGNRKRSSECIGGCFPNDSELEEKNWQGLLKPSNVTANMPMLQDTREKKMWNLLGGGANDYLVYDKSGYIFAYGCSSKTCSNPPSFSNDITTKEGYDNLKSFLVLAANSNPTARCGSRKADPLLKHFAPTSAAENEALDIIVVAVVLVIGMVLGICLLPKLFAFVGILCCSASSIEANRDRFIQLSTIDDLDDDEFNL